MSATQTTSRPVIPALRGPDLPENCTLLQSSDTPVLVRVVFPGDRYGRLDCLVHDRFEPMVEFYDATHDDTPRGFFVSRYYLETLVEAAAATASRERPPGLQLDGQDPRWALNALTLQEAVSFALLRAYRRKQSEFSYALAAINSTLAKKGRAL